MSCTLLQIDAFADRAFTGNPAAVCLLDTPRDPEWMQAVATEMNLSETAFVQPVASGYGLRWFTPTIEVDLCGHATLATAHALWTEDREPSDRELVFHTRSGALTARRQGERIALNFPATPVSRCPEIPGLARALGVPVQIWGRTSFDLFACLEDAEAVRGLQPDMDALSRLDARGILVTGAEPSESLDFVTRFFAPASGIPEDPVTGSAFCALGPFWQEETGKSCFTGYQASARGGTVWLEVVDDRIILEGTAVTVTRGAWIA